MFSYMKAFGDYRYIKYERRWYVLEEDVYEEYMSIPRDHTCPKVDPYKFSVAMLSKFRGKPYVTLITGYESNFDMGFKQGWTAFYEAVNEGVRIFEEDIKRQKEVKEFRKKNK